MALTVDSAALDAFAAANAAASGTISEAGTADHATHMAAATAALGPIGATYLAAYGPAQANNLNATLQVAGLHGAIAAATDAARSAFVVTDNG